MRKDILGFAGAAIFAGAEIVIPKMAAAQTPDIRPVSKALMQEALVCVQTAQPGKTVKEAGPMTGDTRHIVMEHKGKRIEVEATNKIDPSNAFDKTDGRIYMKVSVGPVGTPDESQQRTFVDGRTDNPDLKTLPKEVADIVRGRNFDGKVDDASYPKDQGKIGDIFTGPDGQDPYALTVALYKRFEGKRDIYQKDFTETIRDFDDGCRVNNNPPRKK